MAVNFLIALAIALGSATVILLALIAALKIIKPESFAETIPQPQQPGLAQTPLLPLYQVIDTVTLSALSGEQVASLVRSGGQGPQLLVLSERAENARKNKAVMEETLSPRGQSPSVVEGFRGGQSAQGVRNEVLLGLAG